MYLLVDFVGEENLKHQNIEMSATGLGAAKPLATREDVVRHIKLFPRMETHFRRSGRAVLPNHSLSLPDMYKLFEVWCEEQGLSPGSISMDDYEQVLLDIGF